MTNPDFVSQAVIDEFQPRSIAKGFKHIKVLNVQQIVLSDVSKSVGQCQTFDAVGA